MSLDTTPSERKAAPVKRLGNKLRAALDAMVWDNLQFADAARKADLSVRAMRMALSKPHVVAYLRAEKEVFRASLSSGNLHTYLDVRDNCPNGMARIQAANALERLEEREQVGGARQSGPGLQIVIVQQANGAQVVREPEIVNEINARHSLPKGEGD